MRLLKFTPWALLAILCFSPIPAIADYACSVAEIFECTAVTGCQRVSGEQANLPPFVTLNVRGRCSPDFSAGRVCLSRVMPTR